MTVRLVFGLFATAGLTFLIARSTLREDTEDAPGSETVSEGRVTNAERATERADVVGGSGPTLTRETPLSNAIQALRAVAAESKPPIQVSVFDLAAREDPVKGAETKVALFRLLSTRSPELVQCPSLSDLPPSRVKMRFDVVVLADQLALNGASVISVSRGAPLPKEARPCVESILGAPTTLTASTNRPFLAGYQGPIETDLELGSEPTRRMSDRSPR